MNRSKYKEDFSTGDQGEMQPEFVKSESGYFYIPESTEDDTGEYTEPMEQSAEGRKPIRKFKKETTTSVFDVAAYILKKRGEMSAMKLQKLVYYCQAWSLVWDEAPLYPENIEAWANGPVIRELFNYHRGHFLINEVSIGNPEKLSEVQIETIDAVLDYYGKKSAQWLIDLSHREDPWNNARKGLSDLEKSDRIINLDSIADYYSSL